MNYNSANMNFRISNLILVLIFLAGNITSQVVFINEVLTSPAPNPLDFSSQATTNANSMYNKGTSSQPAFNREWIELYNPHPCDSVDIGCFTIGSNMQPPPSGVPNWGAFTFPPGTKIPPLGYLIIGGNDAQVPFLDFNTTWYRDNSFQSAWLDGYDTRWFLRDQYGWIALFSPNGVVIDAIYWANNGSPSDLFIQEEYQHPLITTTTCTGTKTFSAAVNIPGIEWVGSPMPGSYLSFQRVNDGDQNWFSGPVTPTPRSNNGQLIKPPQIIFSTQNENCSKSNGQISVIVIPGGTGPYSITWNTIPPAFGTTISNLKAGTYTVTVTDFYNCLKTIDSVTITDSPGPVIKIIDVVNETCNQWNGSATADVSGGIPPFSYEWSIYPLQTTPILQNAPNGMFVITVSDNNGCKVQDTVYITNHAAPEIVFQIKDDTCQQGIGEVNAFVTGPTSNYNYLWNPLLSTSSILKNAYQGFYTLVVSDTICSTTQTAYVNNIDNILADFIIKPESLYITNPSCNFIDISKGADWWSWDFGDGNTSNLKNPSHTFSSVGTYYIYLIVENKSGCVDTAFKTLLVKEKSEFFVPNTFTPNSDNLNDIFLAYGTNITDLKFYIFNQWGELLFYSTSLEYGWDGTFKGQACKQDVYVWLAQYTCDDGNGKISTKSERGTLQLLK